MCTHFIWNHLNHVTFLVEVSKQLKDKSSDIVFRYADEISVGDEVLAQTDELNPAKVINVSTVIMEGNPLWFLFYLT